MDKLWENFESNKEIFKDSEFVKNLKQKNITINPDIDLRTTIMTGLVKNKIKYGYMVCPCRIASGDKETDKAITCPCIYMEDDIKYYGKCHCELFVKEESK